MLPGGGDAELLAGIMDDFDLNGLHSSLQDYDLFELSLSWGELNLEASLNFHFDILVLFKYFKILVQLIVVIISVFLVEIV